ncbi:MAG: glycoside hydrolase family 127 protein [Chloroflexota bacterium]|nr:glycoside hydrolase family 127 protein [Chloroflexota bacterium]
MPHALRPPAFTPLPLGAVRPLGWLHNQLRLQADSLSGHLDEFWPDIKESRWFGGEQEGWERAPYWLDGVIPLAYLLDDERLKAKVARHVDYILAHQDEDGWLGPRQSFIHATEQPAFDIWALFLALKMLVQVHDATGDERIPGAVERCLRLIDRHIDRQPLFNWGQFRWFEALIPLYWLYERTGEAWLADLAIKLHAQGFNWAEFFERWPITEPTPMGRWNFMGHVVNNAMAIKAHPLWWRLSGDERDRRAVYDMIAKLDRYHGMATGVFTGDECLAGVDPSQGTELCAVVEYMYSLEWLLSVLGDPAFGDRLERITFNALPATFSPDMWSHQYDQQVNQIECSVRRRNWNTNDDDSNIFGLEPNYGCCTANLSQGWPKFAAHLWMAADDGLAAVAYAPSEVATTIRGQTVRVRLETDYPFSDTLHFTVQPGSALKFPLLLRIPLWAAGAHVTVNGGATQPALPGKFHRIEREWREGDTVLLTLPMRPVVHPRPRQTVAVSRGPLLYALKIGEEWRRIHADQPQRELPHGDWEIYPTTPWNYALAIDRAHPERSLTFEQRPMTGLPFAPDRAPVAAHVKGKRVPGWQEASGSAPMWPGGPATSEEPPADLTLIPYGCTNLRLAEFPLLE